MESGMKIGARLMQKWLGEKKSLIACLKCI